MALMLAGIMVIQSAGTSWAAEFTDGVNVEYGDSSENVNEEAFSDEQTEAENFEDDSPEKDLTEEAEVPAMASGKALNKNIKISFDNGTLTISGSGEVTYTLIQTCGYSLNEIKKVIIKKGITSIEDAAFDGCSSLNSIEIPNSVTNISDIAFRDCSSLNSIEIPNSVTSIGVGAFDGCSSLKNIEISNSVTDIGARAFKKCSNLKSIKIPNNVTSIGYQLFYDCSSLSSIEIPNSVINVGVYAFKGCSNLKSIEIPNSVMSIEDWAFSDCSNLKGIEVPNSVTSIGNYVFSGCSNLTSIKIPNSVTSIEDCTFKDCSNLKSIKIPNSVTSIEDNTFWNCSSLKSIEIPNSVTSIGKDAFNGCSSLSSIEIPNSVTSIGVGVFDSCSSLKSIEIPNSVTSIGSAAFWRCISLRSVKIPNNVTRIESSVFEDCINLSNIEIPNSVVSIEASAFFGCSSLKNIEIPNSVTNIGRYAFTSLTDVYYVGNKEQWEKIKIASENEALLKATIHYNGTISTDKKFNLSIKSFAILGKQNSISVDFEASTSGNVANEEKTIIWKSSNPAIAEIDKNTTGLIHSADGNSAFGWINLLTYDVGEVTITGTTQDGRTASIKINVEPQLNIEKDSIKIFSKTDMILCSVKLKKANKEYLESYMNSLKVEINGSSLNLIGKEAKISDDGKSAELVGTLEPVDNSSGVISTVICSSEGGQKVSTTVNLLQPQYLLKPEQVWGFTQGTITDKLNLSYYMRFYDLAHASILLGADNGSGGYCNGMATSVNALAIYGGAKEKSFLFADGTTSTYLSQVLSNQLRNSTTLQTAADYVKYAHVYQSKSSVQKEYNANRNQLDKLYQAIKASVENSGEPVEISMRGDYNERNKKGKVETKTVGHTLLVTGISYDTRQEMEVLVYDGNYSTNYQKLYLYKDNGNVTSWKYQVKGFLDWGTGKPNNMITYTTQGKEVATILPKALVEDIKDTEKYLISVKNTDSTVGTSSGNYSLKDSANNTVIPIFISNGTADSEKNIYWIDTTDDISIEGSKSDNSIQIASNNKTILADIPASASVAVDMNSLDLKTNISNLSFGKDFSVALTQYTENQTSTTATVTGIAEKKTVTIQKENGDKVNVDGARQAEIQFKNEDGSQTAKIKVDLDGKPSQIEQILNKTTVKQDTDGDGTYDKVLYDSSKTNVKVSTPKPKKVISSYNSLEIRWEKVSGADGYQVYRKVNSGKWKVVKNTTGTSYKDKNVKAGYKYSYTVKAYKKINGKKVYSGYNKKGLSGKLNTVVSLSVKNKTVSISWKKTTGATGYYIYRSGSKNGKFSKIKTITSGKTLKYTDKKVKTGNTYYYKVIPFAKITGKKVNSTSSIIKCISLKKKTPSSNTGTYPAEVQKLITYLKTNGDKWSGGGDNYERTWKISANERVTFQYQSPHDDQKSAVWMAYIITDSNNAAKDETIRISWEGHIFEDLSQTRRISVTYNIEGNDNYIGGDIPFDYSGKEDTTHFTNSSEISFNLYTNKSYTLNQLSAQGNKKLHKALPLFNTYLKQLMGISMSDMGFVDYKF